jgi:hypothetical protein
MIGIANVTFLAAMLLSGSAGAAGLSWQGVQEIATGGGERGPWRQNESRYDYVDDPTVAIDERGEVAVAWVDQGRKDVFFNGVNVSRSPATFSWLPRIAIADREVFVLWQEIIFSGGSHGGDILFARSQDGGSTFSQPLNLSRSVGGDGKGRINKELWHNGSLDIAAGSDGAIYAAWTEYDGPLWLARSNDGGRSFSDPRKVSGDAASPARAPSLALAPDGTLYLAWTRGEDDAADIHVAKSADGGTRFSEPRIVARSEGYSDAPKLAVGAGGVLHLAYAESEDGPLVRHHVRYTRSTDGAQTFAPPRKLSKPGGAFPDLRLDGQGNPYVLWELVPDPRKRPHGLGIAVSRDAGRTFSPPALVPGSADPAGGSNGSHQGLLMRKLAVNHDGAVAIVNSSLKDGEKSRVWLVRGFLQREPQASK